MQRGGRTVAVLGTPLDVVYPLSYACLLRAIVASHAAVSQFPPGRPILRRNIPIRNRTMALLSDATVIVTGGERSGTVHQGREALRLGRELFILESLASSGFHWTQELLDGGARILSDANLDAWLDFFSERVSSGPPPRAAGLVRQ